MPNRRPEGRTVELNFTKMHGLGNDFIAIADLGEELDLSPDAVAYLCDRHFGIGADGVIVLRPARGDADFSWEYINADGTVAEMCGNGIRCMAKFVVDRELVPAEQDVVRIETRQGTYAIEVTRDYDGTMAYATVDMGEPILDPAAIPTTLGCEGSDAPVIACDLDTELGVFPVTCVSMGNPHAVIWVDDVDEAPVETVGPVIETHPAFPRKTNVEFAQLVGDDVIRLRVWERGVGETLACGTGACATLVAATLSCRAGREATIELPGGELAVRWDESGRVFMTGPAAEVYTGTLVIPEDDA